ncbi:MAG: cell division protein ZapA [Phaeospirillum sp.]|nr:cell division protein ZapA [Phaeospirillum sp.]
MALVNITVNGRVYDIACDDSQVTRVQDLGREVDAHAQHLLATIGNVSDSRLLVMVGLLLADELTEVREQLTRLGQEVTAAAEGDTGLAAAIESLAQRIEGIATRLERA